MSSVTGTTPDKTTAGRFAPGRELIRAVVAAEMRLRPHLRETPLERSPRLEELTGVATWLKLENLQHTGSFKVRGALNAMLELAPEDLERGVVAASTGNHGAAVAFAARRVGTRAIVYVPRTASPTKLAAMRRAGAEIVTHGTDGIEAEVEARRVAGETGRVYLSPYNDPSVVFGQGTVGAEIERQSRSVEALFVAVGGGGLISGTAAYLKSLDPEVRIVGCSPEASPVMDESVRRGRIVEMESHQTLSDGTAGGVESEAITFESCRALVDEWVRVSEAEIRGAIVEILESHHQLIEGSAAVAVAGLEKRAADLGVESAVAVICGGNISVETLRGVLEAVSEEGEPSDA